MIRIAKIEAAHPYQGQENPNSQAEENSKKNKRKMHGSKFTEVLMMVLENLEENPTQA